MVDTRLLSSAIASVDPIQDDAYPTAAFNASGARSSDVTLVLHVPSGPSDKEWVSLLFKPEEETSGMIQQHSYHKGSVRATLRAWNLSVLQFSKHSIYGRLMETLEEDILPD